MTNPEKRDTSEANRPAGTVDEDANPALSDSDDDTTVNSATGNVPPQDTGSAIPPYEGRQTSTEK